MADIITALKENKLDKADWLLEQGESPNEVLPEQLVSPMHLAAGLGMTAVCLLLQHGGDPNLSLSDGTTPLHVSAMWGDSDCVQILLSNGGDPYLRDQDGFSAMDFARNYKHEDVIEVIKKYMLLLTTAEEVTLTPKYTYTRRSVDGNQSSNSTINESIVGNIETSIKSDLKDFKRRRRSSVYLHSLQRQMEKYFSEGRKTHIIDVTSPDHPYVEPKYTEMTPSSVINNTSQEESLHLHLSLSDNEDSTCTSSASFVTCEGEDLDTCIKMSSLQVGDDTNCSTVSIKHQSPPENKCDNKSGRNKKYCRRLPLFPSDTQDLFSCDQTYEKCDYCESEIKRSTGAKGTVCLSCEKLGLELEELTLQSNESKKLTETSEHQPTNEDYVYTASQGSQYNKTSGRCRFDKVDRTSNQFHTKNKSQQHGVGVNLTKGKENQMYTSIKDNPVDRDLNHCFIQSISDDSLISQDQSYVGGRIEKVEFHPSDISTITVSDHSGSQDKAFMQSDSQSSVDVCNTTLKQKVTNSRQSFVSSGKQKVKLTDNCNQNAKNMNENQNSADITVERQNSCSPQLDDLWTEVRASAMKAKRFRDKRRILDTAFIGRESMNSAVSGVSDASTIDYVYTDKENGIVLLERHLPSLCSSQGSRRSLESLVSVDGNSLKGGNSPHNTSSASSEDTVHYDWREHAMIGASDDSGNGESLPNSVPLSQELLNMADTELRSKLREYWEDPGPITTSTRQMYLRRLSQLQNDPSAKWLTKKGPEYTPELSLALNGKLDLADCVEVEAKMVDAFQNPDRMRRWREGTLKSSFNYVLLDPRITDNLPNRAINMNDLDIFQTFISAIFYVGKGKRARPYCHLYEAIKHMKKPGGKVSRKVQQIIDIWADDMGVVSLHCFQSVIPVEAYTREACMVDAIGLKNLTNMKRGDYYGVSTTFPMKQRRRVGVFLLTKALQIFLAEGERQISPLDIKNDP